MLFPVYDFVRFAELCVWCADACHQKEVEENKEERDHGVGRANAALAAALPLALPLTLASWWTADIHTLINN